MPVVVTPRSRRVIQNPLPAKYVDAVTKASVFLVNLSDLRYVLHRTYGVYVILGVEEGEDYTSQEIHGRIETMDIGDEKATQQLTEAEDIGADLARECNEGLLTAPGGDSFMGVFVSPTRDPAAKVLAAMKARLNHFYDEQIGLADSFWDDPRDHKNISSLHRRAAKVRHQTRPWTYESVNTALCPACGKSITVGVAICATCGAIVDETKARKFFPERFAHEAAAEQPKHRPAPKTT